MTIKFDMIELFVKDMRTMVKFYRDVVGLKVEWDGAEPYAEFEHQGIRFAFYERNKLPELLGQEPTYPSGLNGTFELAIDLPPLRMWRGSSGDSSFRVPNRSTSHGWNPGG